MTRVITIDGPSGSGKSTVSRLLAGRLSFLYLDTGAMYRAVALAAREKDIPIDDPRRLGELCETLDLRFRTDTEPPRLVLGTRDITMEIRSPGIDLLSSSISAVREVRAAMTGLQRAMAEGTDVVAEGRDMGTVVFPDAVLKFFLTASAETRAERRYRERLARGESVCLDAVAEEMRRRDRQDSDRALAPLRPADDAVILDSTVSTVDEIVELILAHFEIRLKNGTDCNK